MEQSPVTFRKCLASDHRALADARLELVGWLCNLQPGSLTEGWIHDVALVIAELGANVVDHTTSPWVEIELRVGSVGALIEVRNQGASHRLPPVDSWGSSIEARRGRGLAIVRALAERVEVTGDDEVSIVRGWLAIQGG